MPDKTEIESELSSRPEEGEQAPRGEAATPAGTGEVASEAPVPAPDVEALQRERDDYYDRLLRKTAEFENYRRRVDKERRELVQYAASELLEELLPVLDNFERALRAEAPVTDAFRAGIELIYKQLVDQLTRRGVVPIEAVGKDFDPQFHQAITHEECPGKRDGEVIEEVQRGYMYKERLLRPAMVKVAKA